MLTHKRAGDAAPAEVRLAALQPHAFDGAWTTSCKLLPNSAGKVLATTDFNAIARSASHSVSLTSLRVQAAADAGGSGAGAPAAVLELPRLDTAAEPLVFLHNPAACPDVAVRAHCECKLAPFRLRPDATAVLRACCRSVRVEVQHAAEKTASGTATAAKADTQLLVATIQKKLPQIRSKL